MAEEGDEAATELGEPVDEPLASSSCSSHCRISCSSGSIVDELAGGEDETAEDGEVKVE